MNKIIAGLLSIKYLCEEFNPEKYAAPADRMASPSTETVNAAQKELQKEEEEARVKEAKMQLTIDKYTQGRNAIDIRYKKRVNTIDVKYLKLLTEENEKYSAGGVETRLHKENVRNIEKDKQNELDKAESSYNEDIRLLNTQLPDGRRFCSNNGIYFS